MKPHELAGLRDALAARQREAVEARSRADAAAAALQHERELFTRSVGTVSPLRRPAVASPVAGPAARPGAARPRPEPRPLQRERDDAAVLVESIGHGVDAETLLDTDDALSFRRPGVGPDVLRKLRRGVWAVQAELDLHGLRRDAAQERLAAFLQDVAAAGLRCIRVVHGKGLGSPGREPVLKSRVKAYLARRSEVIAFVHARAADGGHGALIVLLRSGPGR